MGKVKGIYLKDSGKYCSVYWGKDNILKYAGTYGTKEEAINARQSGHWRGYADPTKFFGFVYRIDQKSTGMSYIGCKQYWFFRGPCESSNNISSPKWNEECWYPSDWRSYNSSSKILAPLIDADEDDFEFTILSQHLSKLGMVKAEVAAMEEADVLEASLENGGRKFYNQHIGSCSFNLLTPRSPSEETRAKMSKAQKGKVQSRETISKKNKSIRDSEVYSFLHNTGEVFTGTRSSFYSKYSLNETNVARVISGERKTTGGWAMQPYPLEGGMFRNLEVGDE